MHVGRRNTMPYSLGLGHSLNLPFGIMSTVNKERKYRNHVTACSIASQPAAGALLSDVSTKLPAHWCSVRNVRGEISRLKGDYFRNMVCSIISSIDKLPNIFLKSKCFSLTKCKVKRRECLNMEVGVISGPSFRGDTLNFLGWWFKLLLLKWFWLLYDKMFLLVRKMGEI